MQTSTSTTHDEMVSLLWELKAAWQARGGGEVLLASLLMNRSELDRFLAEAAEAGDASISALVARIVSMRAALEPASSSRPFARPDSALASSRGSRVPKAGFETIRSAAVLLASLLVSIAAARYLWVERPEPVSADWTASAQASAASPDAAPVPPIASSTPALAVVESAASVAPTLLQSEIVLRIHGSNTVGEKLSPGLVEAFLRSLGATEVSAVNSASSAEKTLVAALPGRERPVGVEIHAHGSSSAFTDLAAGRADLGQSSRRIKPEETASALATLGDLSRPDSEHVLALDGLAIVVHPENPLKSLSIGQIADVFAGRTRDWSELGGSPGPIALYARDDASGTWETFKHLVLAPLLFDLDPAARRYESSGELSEAVASDASAIGFVGLPYVRRTKVLAVSAEAGGVALLPTSFTVGTEDYPLSRRLYLYAPAVSANDLMRDFVDFALSAEGQDIVQKIGFVSQNLGIERPHIEAGAPSDYRRAAENAGRLSLNFRFEAGSEALDAKGLRDLDRVVDYLADDRGREVMLLGFTDDRGDLRTNVGLSRSRAQVVARALETRGVFSRKVLGFGEALPVASNSSEEGRNRNRRVEVWVR